MANLKLSGFKKISETDRIRNNFKNSLINILTLSKEYTIDNLDIFIADLEEFIRSPMNEHEREYEHTLSEY